MGFIRCASCNGMVDAACAGGFCPTCGAPQSAMRAATVVQGIDLRQLARRQRWMIWSVLASMVSAILPFLTEVVAPGELILGMLLQTVLGLACTVVMIMGLVGVMASLGRHLVLRIFVCFLMFVPLISLLVLLRYNRKATRLLRDAGLKVGLMGASDEQILRVLSLNRCHSCGYDLTGNVSGRCPECGWIAGAASASSMG